MRYFQNSSRLQRGWRQAQKQKRVLKQILWSGYHSLKPQKSCYAILTQWVLQIAIRSLKAASEINLPTLHIRPHIPDSLCASGVGNHRYSGSSTFPYSALLPGKQQIGKAVIPLPSCSVVIRERINWQVPPMRKYRQAARKRKGLASGSTTSPTQAGWMRHYLMKNTKM